jgi:hypothetical protein
VTTSNGDGSWSLPVLRAVPAAVVALLITFSSDHSTTLGFLSLGSWAIVTAAVLGFGAIRGFVPRVHFLVQAATLLAGGIVAIAANREAVSVLLFLTSTLFAVTAITEIAAGVARRGVAQARDWIFTGGLSALLAIAVLVIPADFNQTISVPGKVVPPLTASVIVVGLLGAYFAIAAVYLVIAGLSLRWAKNPTAVASQS